MMPDILKIPAVRACLLEYWEARRDRFYEKAEREAEAIASIDKEIPSPDVLHDLRPILRRAFDESLNEHEAAKREIEKLNSD